MEAPKVIYTNRKGNAIVVDLPVWESDVKYIRADAPDLVALVDALRGIVECPAIADEDFNHPEFGCGDSAVAESLAHKALAAWEALTNE